MLRLTKNRHSFAELVGLPIIRLTTIGAKTLQPRTMPLVGIFADEKFILIASSFGRAHNPGWYHNLKAHPECEVSVTGTTRAYIAREAVGEEYAEHWRLVVSYYAGYEKYRERAAPRRIPLVVLEPKK